MYAQNAIVVNEFLGNSWKKVMPRMHFVLVYLSLNNGLLSSFYIKILLELSVGFSWVLHRWLLVLAGSRGSDWFYSTVPIRFHSGSKFSQSSVSLHYSVYSILELIDSDLKFETMCSIWYE